MKSQKEVSSSRLNGRKTARNTYAIDCNTGIGQYPQCITRRWYMAKLAKLAKLLKQKLLSKAQTAEMLCLLIEALQAFSRSGPHSPLRAITG